MCRRWFRQAELVIAFFFFITFSSNVIYLQVYILRSQKTKRDLLPDHAQITHNGFESYLNTSYLTDSYIIFTLKMEYNFWPKNDGEKWSRNIYFEIPPSMREDCYFYYWICDFGHFYEVRKNSLPHGGISKRFFYTTFHNHF